MNKFDSGADDDDKEDGQVQSPDNISNDESLDIKPPQARTEVRHKDKKLPKEKKHSKEHRYKEKRRHKEPEYEEGNKFYKNRGPEQQPPPPQQQQQHFDRPRMDRGGHRPPQARDHRQQQPPQYNQPYAGSGGGLDQRIPKFDTRDLKYQEPTSSATFYRERDRQRDIHYQRVDARPEKPHQQIRVEKPHRISYEAEKDRRRESDETDPERLLEDLRNRLLNKKNKHESQKTGETAKRGDKTAEKHHKHREERKDFIEDIDSPEMVPLEPVKGSTETKSGEIQAQDKEKAARRARLLQIEREMTNRKLLAQQELETRREQRREKLGIAADAKSPPYSPEPVKKKKRRTMEEEPLEEKEPKKKSRHEKHRPEVVEVSESGEDSEEVDEEELDDEDDNDTEMDSNDTTSNEEVSDTELPLSPLSVGKLTKSEREHRRSRSLSRSPPRSKGRRTRSRSRSKTPLSRRSATRSRSRSMDSRSSRSRSSTDDRRRNHERSRSPSPTAGNNKHEKTPEPAPKEEEVVVPVIVLPPYFPALQGCRSVEEFQCLNRIEEGTYGVVYRAKDKRTEEIVALKRLKMEKEKEGFPITSLREINTLLKGQHPNIVTVREIVVGSNMDKIFIVMDYVEHDLKSLMETMKHKKQVFLPGEVKCLTHQLLRAVAHLHDNWILHRDLKTSNLLLSHKGILKVGDFGLAREYGSPLKAYTSIVVTLWYRAPELLLCCKEYSTPIDMWSVGCIFAEFLAMTALFPGKSEIDQLNRIFKDMGTPNEKIWPGYNELPAVQKMTFTEYPVSQLRKKFAHLTSELGMSLLHSLLTYDPKQRLTAETAMKHNYFKELPLPIDPAMFPTWPAKSELGLKKALASSPKPPSGGGEFKKLGEDGADPHGFHLGANIAQSLAESRLMAKGPGFTLKF